jgi:hypothetical protein
MAEFILEKAWWKTAELEATVSSWSHYFSSLKAFLVTPA